MDPAHAELDVPAGGNSKVVDDEDKNWHKRLRLRKAAVQPPTMQSEDKHWPNKMGDKEKSTEQRYLKKTPLKAQKSQHVTKVYGNILRFRCFECKGSTEFSPNDLLRHFQETHPGSQPIFPCDICSFITQEFSRLQVHQLGHRDTFVSCNICNDNVQRTLLQLTTHLNMHHSLNGHYSCEKCKFSTRDVGEFLEHMYLHNMMPQAGGMADNSNPADPDLQRHLMAKTAQFPFSCQFCDYKALRKDIITKHMATIHGKETSQKNKLKMKEFGPKTVDNSSPRLKHTVTRSTVRENNWMSQGCLSLSGEGFLDKYCRLSNPERALEETQQFLEKSVAAEALKTVLSNVPKAMTSFSNSDNCMISNPGFPNTGKDLTVLMLKNKISVPPNGTTEAIGLKMVEGKKHLVLKVTPSAKQETSDKTEASLHSIETKEDNTASKTCTMSQNSLVVVDKSQPNLKIAPSTPTNSSLEYHFENVELPNTVSSENTGGMNNGMDSHVLDGQDCSRVGLPHVSNGAKSAGNHLGQMTEEKLEGEAVNYNQPDLEGVGPTEAQVIMMSPSPILHFLTSPQGIKNLSENPVNTPDVCFQDFPPNTTLRDVGEQEGFDRICLSPQKNEQTVRGKRQSELSTEDSPEPLSKAFRKVVGEEEASPAAVHHREPGPRDVERTLKLLPLSLTQLITRPRGDQPVVVLNHPDTDIHEVTNIMETVHRYKGEVQKVVLSRKTLKALAAMGCDMFRANAPANERGWPESRVKERFILKMKLKKMSRKKYKVVNAISHSTEPPLRFSCWFCGRVFSDQEVWIGHGQRHLMESTREWDRLESEKS
ncbi:hypothetical protein J4Q44_G00357710 [Coregonus suidteri]|uniref:C2H2-type domain-containing protein n=1 Tax=Coregonus suidteri TaxID=861788 RepID=A0AAN8KQF5_9TELE